MLTCSPQNAKEYAFDVFGRLPQLSLEGLRHVTGMPHLHTVLSITATLSFLGLLVLACLDAAASGSAAGAGL
jgi:hypothetical protein